MKIEIKILTTSMLLAGIFSFAAAPAPIRPPAPSIDNCNINNTAFVSGERLVYKVYYNWNFVWMSAGEVVMTVKDEGDNYHYSATGRTYKSYEWFYKVRDNYDSWVDKNTLLPVQSIRDIKEGGFSFYSKQNFNQAAHTLHTMDGTPTKKDAENNQTDFKVSGCIHDILSLMYFARNLEQNNYKKDDRIPVKLFMDRAEWKLNVKYLGKAPKYYIKDVGTYNLFKFEPELIKGGTFQEDASMTVYASDDKNRIPVLIESALSVGSIKVILTEAKGLRYPLSAKIK